MPETEVFHHYDLSGGLNTESSPRMLEPEFSVELVNLMLDEVGDLNKRHGYKEYAPSLGSEPIMGLHRFYRKDGDIHLLAVSDGEVYETEDGTSWSEIYDGLDTAERVFFLTWRDHAYFATVDGLFKWQEGDVVELERAPEGKFVAEHLNRLYVAGAPDHPSRLYYANVGDDDITQIVGERIYPKPDKWVELPHAAILEGTERVFGVDDEGEEEEYDRSTEEEDKDYQINYERGLIRVETAGAMFEEISETFSGMADSWIDLDGYDIPQDTETVSLDGTEYTEGEGEDYEMDYVGGRVRINPDGDMPQENEEEFDDYAAHADIDLEHDHLVEDTFEAVAEDVVQEEYVDFHLYDENEEWESPFSEIDIVRAWVTVSLEVMDDVEYSIYIKRDGGDWEHEHTEETFGGRTDKHSIDLDKDQYKIKVVNESGHHIVVERYGWAVEEFELQEGIDYELNKRNGSFEVLSGSKIVDVEETGVERTKIDENIDSDWESDVSAEDTVGIALGVVFHGGLDDRAHHDVYYREEGGDWSYYDTFSTGFMHWTVVDVSPLTPGKYQFKIEPDGGWPVDIFWYEYEYLKDRPQPRIDMSYKYTTDYNITFEKLASPDEDEPGLFYIDYDVSAWNTEGGLLQYIDLSTDIGEEITGLVPAFEEIIVFKDRSSWILYGHDEETFEMRRFLPKTGCIAPKSIAAYQSKIIFLSHKGVIALDKEGADNLSYMRVQGLLEDCEIPEEAAGVIHDNKYWLAYSENGSYNDTVLVYDIIHDCWTKFENIHANDFALGTGAGELRRLFWGSSQEGMVYEEDDTYSDAGEPILAKHTTPALALDSPEMEKLYRKLSVDMEWNEEESSVDVNVDTESDTETFEHEDRAKSLRNKQGPDIQLTVEEESTEPFKLRGYVLKYRPRRFLR